MPSTHITADAAPQPTTVAEPQHGDGPAAQAASSSSRTALQIGRLTDELIEARADRDLAEAENRSLNDHHAELRIELRRLQAQVEGAASRGRLADRNAAEPGGVALADALAYVREQLESERERRLAAMRGMEGLEADLEGVRSRLADAETEVRRLLLERESILTSTSWKLVSRLHTLFASRRRG